MGQCTTAGQIQMPKTIQKQSLDLFFDKQFRQKFIIFSTNTIESSLEWDDKFQQWFTNVLTQILSTTFHYVQTQKIRIEDAKLYFCSNVLKNIISLRQKYNLAENHLKQINKFIAEQLVPYLIKKFKISSQNQLNKKFLKVIRQIDNLQDYQNDYISKSPTIFQYRQNGNYNDLIMKFLNELLQLPEIVLEKITQNNKNLKNENDTLFNIFTKFINQLFESSANFDLINGNNSVSNKMTQQQKDEYTKEVKNYSYVLIGRKLSQNINLYTAQQINNNSIPSKGQGLLRILTKWAEQLWKNFNNPMAFVDRAEPYNYFDKRPGFSLPRIDRLTLYKIIQEEKKVIQQQIKKINEQIYKFQSVLLKQANNRYINFIPQLQFKEGFFAYNCFKALDSYTIKYINILIHGLLKVSKRFYEQPKMKKKLTAPYQLITFKIGDLLRCKIHSKQKQVLYIYDKIMNCNPDILKVIRIKNRLQTVNQDILINAKFYKSVIIEIQLGIDSKKQNYTLNCTKFNHLVYELERSQFGPIMQMCSIWYHYNPKAEKLGQSIKKSHRKQNSLKELQNICVKNHQFQIQTDPFVCHQCSQVFGNDQNLIQNQKCKKCNYYICSFCRINKLSQQDLKKIIFKNDEVRKNCHRCYIRDTENLPTCAIIFDKCSKNRKLTAYKVFKDQLGKNIFIQKKKNSAFQLLNLNKKNIDNYLIWENQSLANTYFEGESEQNIKKHSILPNMFKEDQIKNKNNVQFQKNNLTTLQFENYLNKYWNQDYRKNIQTLNLTQNKITDIDLILKKLPMLKFLILDGNEAAKIQIPKENKTLQKLSMTRIKLKENQKLQIIKSDFSSLKYLNIGWSKIYKLPQNLKLLTNLQQLSAQTNQLTQIFNDIKYLTKLKILALNGNKIQQFCSGVWELYNLQQLQAKGNLINKIPKQINKLKCLKKIRMDDNKLTQLPQQIGELQNLIQISVKNNKLTKLPNSLKNLKNLQFLYLSSNEINQINDVKYLVSLQKLSLDKNKISNSFNIQNLIKLKCLQLQGNQLTIINKNHYKSESLQQLNLSNNKLIQIYQTIQGLILLKKLNLSKNKLKNLPNQISGLQNLLQLNIQQNQFDTIPLTFCHFLKLAKITISDMKDNYEIQNILKKLQEKGIKVQRIQSKLPLIKNQPPIVTDGFKF